MVITKFNNLSRNALIIINELVEREDFLKFLTNNSKEPLSQEIIGNPSSLLGEKLFITPFAGDVPKETCTNIRIHYNGGRIERRVFLVTEVVFEILIHKDLWYVRDKEGNQSLRPFELMDEIVDTFEDRTIGTLGVLHFVDYKYYKIDNSWGVYTLKAQMRTL